MSTHNLISFPSHQPGNAGRDGSAPQTPVLRFPQPKTAPLGAWKSFWLTLRASFLLSSEE
jgi:hypothetical protein